MFSMFTLRYIDCGIPYHVKGTAHNNLCDPHDRFQKQESNPKAMLLEAQEIFNGNATMQYLEELMVLFPLYVKYS